MYAKNVKNLKNKQEKESAKIEVCNGDSNLSYIGLWEQDFPDDFFIRYQFWTIQLMFNS